MLALLVSILIAAIVIGLLYWIVTLIPLPAPMDRILQVVVVVIFVIYLLYMLLPYSQGKIH